MTTTLLCSSDPGRTQEIQQALHATDVNLQQHFSDSRSLTAHLEYSSGTGIDLIVVDESAAPLPVWELVRRISVSYPDIAVIAVITEPDQSTLATAIDSGARGVVGYPINFEDIAGRVAAATAWGRSVRVANSQQSAGIERRRSVTMFTVAGSKGGVGTSTIALHLALDAQAENPGARVVLADFDLQKPDQTSLLNIPRRRDVTDLLSVVDELSPRHLEDVLYRHESGLQVLAGPHEGERGELIEESSARQILGQLSSVSDVLVVDIGSVMGEANAVAVELADHALVVGTPDVMSLRGANRLTALWDRLGIRQESRTHLLINRTDKQNDLQLDSVRKIATLPVLGQIVPDLPKALEAANNRRDPSVVPDSWRQRIGQVRRELDGSAGERAEQRRLERAQNSQRFSSRRRERGTVLGRDGERGAISIEFLATVPLILLGVLIACQLLLVGTTWIFAGHSAAEGARAAAVGKDPAASSAEEHTEGLERWTAS